ncbi:cytochrome oxidase maturation protein, cbb3-type [Catalinimonas alkaloidigena]|uniref:Cytochrome oxidase maturation protein, cbb3-type n=2 Tax=Catalinimonas alkaloidigena TaxID=1075417 RepID=A0A1G8WD39_9BACT|nr:cytochrome oxidase maturation protein, cbb3-type [Catalinimonas alkaloidigena]
MLQAFGGTFVHQPDTSMSALFILIGVSLVVASGFLGAFLWATHAGQFDDDYTPSVRMLFDDDKPDSKPE